MVTSVTGVGSLNYTGVGAPNPPNLVILKRAPNSNDSQNFTLGSFWLYSLDETQELWILVSLAGNIATWVQLYPGAGGGASQFPTDSGTANEAGGVLNVLGGVGISTSGSGNTITIAQSAAVADSFPTDSGTAIPSAGALTVHGGANINTSGAGSTVTVNLDNNVTIGASLTLPTFPGVLQASNSGLVSASRGTDGQLLIGNTGVNPAWANITSTDGSVVITNGAGSINLAVTGSDASSFVTQSGTATPASGVLHINGTNLLTTSAPGSSNIVDVTLTNGTNGQIPIGGGASPAWANITSNDGSVAITNGANTIDLSASAAEGSTAFQAVQISNTAGVTGDPASNQVYSLGSSVAMMTNFDPGSNFYPGDGLGTPCNYTAPTTGLYQFNFQAITKNINVASVTSWPANLFINTPGGTFESFIFRVNSTSWNGQNQVGISFSQLVSLTAGDQVTFSVVIRGYAASSYSVNGLTPNGNYGTMVSGYRVG